MVNPTVCLVEPNLLIREGLTQLLTGSSFAVSYEVTPMADTPQSFVINASAFLSPDLIRQASGQGRVIAYGRPMTAPLALRSMSAGAMVVLSDGEGADVLYSALTDEAPRPMTELMATAVAVIRLQRSSLARLTPREYEVLVEIAEGGTPATIADSLGISETTVANHLQRSMKKLNATSRSDAIFIARSMGILAPR